MNKEQLLKKLKQLLNEYEYEYSTHALRHIIDEWYDSKSQLRDILSKHPNWVGTEDMIVFDIDMKREIDRMGVCNFIVWLNQEFPNNNIIIPFSQYLEEMDVEMITNKFPDFKGSRVGAKTSKVMNKLFQHLGYNTHEEYNREFAKYSDAINPLTIKRHTVISINLLDYLTMSFGNSWASCHTIDKTNKRGMPDNYSGCYSSGTLSYALDETSIVFYTVDAKYDGNEYYFESKINRQMFHWGEEKMVQGRLYPQSCDNGAMNEYTMFRNIMQDIFATCLEIPNLWVLSRGTDACRSASIHCGTNYPDYHHFDNCTVSRIKGSDNNRRMLIGTDPICIECGNRHESQENINCCSNHTVCASCGGTIDVDDGDYEIINGEYYCYECCSYCEECGEYHLNEDMTWVDCESTYVCDDCLDCYYEKCYECGEYHRRSDMEYVDDEYVCSGCLDYYYRECYECGEYHHRDDMYEHDGEWYCDDCYDEVIVPCENCCICHHKDDMYEYDGKLYCEDCIDELDEEDEDNE